MTENQSNDMEQIPEEFVLDDLLSLITPETLHGEIDFGLPVGKEEF